MIWLHPYSYARGYSPYSGPPFDSPPFADLTRRGFAVLAFDQLGFGTRVLDARRFYEQCPKWSLMGKMIADTRAAVDAVSALDMIDLVLRAMEARFERVERGQIVSDQPAR